MNELKKDHSIFVQNEKLKTNIFYLLYKFPEIRLNYIPKLLYNFKFFPSNSKLTVLTNLNLNDIKNNLTNNEELKIDNFLIFDLFRVNILNQIETSQKIFDDKIKFLSLIPKLWDTTFHELIISKNLEEFITLDLFYKLSFPIILRILILNQKILSLENQKIFLEKFIQFKSKYDFFLLYTNLNYKETNLFQKSLLKNINNLLENQEDFISKFLINKNLNVNEFFNKKI